MIGNLTAFVPFATQDAEVTAEVDFYIASVNAKLARKPRGGARLPPPPQADLDDLKVHVSTCLSQGFGLATVDASIWAGGVHAKAMSSLWDSTSNVVSTWRELLREHWSGTPYCPFCGMYRNAAIDNWAGEPVDHYLPRNSETGWPELSIVATNLVPICDTCNSPGLKGSKAPAPGAARLFIHPFYDDFVEGLEVVASVGMIAGTGGESSVEFSFDYSSLIPLSVDAQDMVSSHFQELNLTSRYRRKATFMVLPELLAEIKYRRSRNRCRDVTDVRFELEMRFQTSLELYGASYWKTGLYRAMHGSEEFCGWLFEQTSPGQVGYARDASNAPERS